MNIVIIGASRGLGHAMSVGLNKSGRHLYLISRSEPQVMKANDKNSYTWIQADVSSGTFTQTLKDTLRNIPVHVLIYNAAVWEKNTFRGNYQITDDGEDELRNIININLTGAILTVQALLPNLRAQDSKIIFIGSTSGVDGNRTKAVAYSASKFGLRGVNNALRENFRGTNINSTILNLGDLSTTIPYEDGKEAVVNQKGYSLIPMQEVMEILECIINLSPATLIKEMDIPGSRDGAL